LFLIVITSLAVPLGAVFGVHLGGHLPYAYAFLVSAILGGILVGVPLIFVYVRWVPLVERKTWQFIQAEAASRLGSIQAGDRSRKTQRRFGSGHAQQYSQAGRSEAKLR